MDENGKITLMGAGIILLGSALAGTLGYGTYGYLKETKGMSSWKAGAATGTIGGAIGILSMYILNAMGTRVPGVADQNTSGYVINKLGAFSEMPLYQPRLNTLPRVVTATAGYAIERLSGCKAYAA